MILLVNGECLSPQSTVPFNPHSCCVGSACAASVSTHTDVTRSFLWPRKRMVPSSGAFCCRICFGVSTTVSPATPTPAARSHSHHIAQCGSFHEDSSHPHPTSQTPPTRCCVITILEVASVCFPLFELLRYLPLLFFCPLFPFFCSAHPRTLLLVTAVQ